MDYDSFQMRNAIGNALRRRGFAVMIQSPAPNSNTGAVLTVSNPNWRPISANLVSVQVTGSPEHPYRWTEPLYELESKLTRITSPEKAEKACDSCREALAGVLLSRKVETLRDFYRTTYPNNQRACFINPLTTVEDAASAPLSLEEQIRLTGIADSKVHRNMLSALGARYGLSLEDMMHLTEERKSIMDTPVLGNLAANGAYINKAADELVVSHLSDPDREIIVFECSARRLCELYELKKADGPLMVNLSDITPSLEVKGRYASLHALAAAGHLQGESETQFESVETPGDLEAFVDITRVQEERARTVEVLRNTEPDLKEGARSVMDTVLGGCDLYNTQTGEYCCLYNDEGSIMVGTIQCDDETLIELASSPQFDFYQDLTPRLTWDENIVDSNKYEIFYGNGLPNPENPPHDARNEVFERIASQEGWGPATAERVLASVVERLTDESPDVASLAEVFPTGVSEVGGISKNQIGDTAVEH